MLIRVAILATLLLPTVALAQSSLRTLPKAALVHLDYSAAVEGSAHRVEREGADSQQAASPDQDPTGVLPSVSLELYGHADFAGDFESGDSNLSTRRGGWRAQVSEESDERVLAFEIGIEGSFYQFSGVPPLGGVSVDPFNDLYRTQLGFSYARIPELGHLGGFAGVEVTFGGEDEVQTTDGVSGGILTGLRYRAAPNLTLAAGLAGISRLEDDARIWPFIGFEWGVTDDVHLSILGPDIELSWQTTETVRSMLIAEYDMRQYRLNEDGPTAGAALRDEEIRIGAGLEWSPKSSVQLRLEGGLTLWRELTVLPGSGLSTASEIEPTPFLGIELVFSF
ncbi:MAG: hypothetical protein ACI8QC_004493 [Planctomycetota bacterium]|jgi:hypothetical protein